MFKRKHFKTLIPVGNKGVEVDGNNNKFDLLHKCPPKRVRHNGMLVPFCICNFLSLQALNTNK